VATIATEKELEDFLYETFRFDYNNSELSDYLDEGGLFRQVNINGYGIIDLIHISLDLPEEAFGYPEIKITIIELKKDQVDIKALEQISRYRTAIVRYISKILDVSKKKLVFKVDGLLIGKGINEQGDFVYLLNNIEWLRLLLYSIDLDSGLTLTEEEFGWFAVKEDFSSLKECLPRIMPRFFNLYKKWHNYCLIERSKNKEKTEGTF